MHPKSNWENFGNFFAHREIVLVKGWDLQNKKLPKSCTKKAFSETSIKRADHPLLEQNSKDIEGHFFLRQKIAPTSKNKSFFSPLSKIGDFENWKKAFLSGHSFLNFFWPPKTKPSQKRKKSETSSAGKNSWGQKQRCWLWSSKSPTIFFENWKPKINPRKKDYGLYRS